MTIVLVLVLIIIGICSIWGIVERDPEGAAWLAGICTFAVMLLWALIAGPMSTYKQNKCEDLAEGYGLERSDWSIRLGCRVYLPTGQLVPEDRIRITSDGQIFVAGDE